MPYITPPPSKRRSRGVFHKRRQPIYYEDVYGVEKNEEERFDRNPDRCETESESESDYETDESPIRTKVSQRLPPRLKRKREVRDTGDEQETSEGLFVSEDEGDTVRYKIAPNVNSKRSIPVPRMTPKKFGIFGSRTYRKEAEKTTVPNDDQPRPEEQSSKKAEPREQRGRIKRPASRQLLKKQLADLDKSKKEARKAELAQQKAAKEAKKARKVKVKTMTIKGGSKKLKQANGFFRSLSVYIDNDEIDFDEYERFDD
ncbi:hypothetical protein PRZ48_001061 [Zasmidium cellare]|uniref:Uncharacterized protein n=1 Tax=Zasmidium cellare TaxID=395010 RepID=A0ABR0F1S8_ZASCE|nr:hypothetical protein PRZ48_001061 [Zasmidium cellare]